MSQYWGAAVANSVRNHKHQEAGIYTMHCTLDRAINKEGAQGRKFISYCKLSSLAYGVFMPNCAVWGSCVKVASTVFEHPDR